MSPMQRGCVRTLIAVAGLACAVIFVAELAAQKPADDPAAAGQSAGARPPGEKPAGEEAGVEVIYPPDKAVLPSGDFDVICRGDDARLRVDGEPYRWEPFDPPVRVAHVSLYCGPNTLEIGPKRVEVFVAETAGPKRVEVFVAETAVRPGGPEGWPMWRKHPISGSGAARCGDCHEIEGRGDGVAVGRLAGYKACFECHKAVEFEAIHSHPLEPIESCQMCHSLHAAKEKALLKAPAKKLCDECHES